MSLRTRAIAAYEEAEERKRQKAEREAQAYWEKRVAWLTEQIAGRLDYDGPLVIYRGVVFGDGSEVPVTNMGEGIFLIESNWKLLRAWPVDNPIGVLPAYNFYTQDIQNLLALGDMLVNKDPQGK